MKKRRIVKKILITIVSLIFIISSYAMLSNNKMQIELLQDLNLLDYKTALGFISAIIALSLWVKKTRQIAILVATAYLGGAVASEFSLGGSGLIPSIVILILWIIHKLDMRPCSCGTCASCTQKNTPPTFQ